MVIAYKLGRGAVMTSAALVLAIVTLVAGPGAVRSAVEQLAAHTLTAFSSHVVMPALQPLHVWLAVTGLAASGVVGFVEGWALQRGYRWAPWLVIGLTSSLVPLELAALIAKLTLPRVAVLALNLLVISYLLWQQLRRVPVEERQFWSSR